MKPPFYKHNRNCSSLITDFDRLRKGDSYQVQLTLILPDNTIISMITGSGNIIPRRIPDKIKNKNLKKIQDDKLRVEGL
jgi:hypothetical protein